MNTIRRNKTKGFTLVELIVVLVILAILAGMLVPALLGYIDKAKEQDEYLAANNMMKAAQAELDELYAKDYDKNWVKTNRGIIPGVVGLNNNNKNIWAQDSDFAKRVKALADDEPYLFFVGLGHSDDNNTKEKRPNMYTVYYAAYWKDPDSNPLFFDGSNWTRDYPIKDKKNYTPNGVHFQICFISNRNNWFSESSWETLRNAAGYYTK